MAGTPPALLEPHGPPPRHRWAAALVAALLAGCGSAESGAAPTTSPGTAGSVRPPTATASGAVALAAPAKVFVDAVNATDLDGLVSAFAADGEVIDVTRPIRGRDAIRDWARTEVMGGRLTVLSVTPTPAGQDLLVHWAPGGTGGFKARYRLSLSGSSITRAELQYA